MMWFHNKTDLYRIQDLQFQYLRKELNHMSANTDALAAKVTALKDAVAVLATKIDALKASADPAADAAVASANDALDGVTAQIAGLV